MPLFTPDPPTEDEEWPKCAIFDESCVALYRGRPDEPVKLLLPGIQPVHVATLEDEDALAIFCKMFGFDIPHELMRTV